MTNKIEEVSQTEKKEVRPPSPETLNALSFFNSLNRQGYGNRKSIIDCIQKNKKNNKVANRQYQDVQTIVNKIILDTNEAVKLKAILEEEKKHEDNKIA
jgi:hypothetical protein